VAYYQAGDYYRGGGYYRAGSLGSFLGGALRVVGGLGVPGVSTIANVASGLLSPAQPVTQPRVLPESSTPVTLAAGPDREAARAGSHQGRRLPEWHHRRGVPQAPLDERGQREGGAPRDPPHHLRPEDAQEHRAPATDALGAALARQPRRHHAV